MLDRELEFFKKYSCYSNLIPRTYKEGRGSSISIGFETYLSSKVSTLIDKWGTDTLTIQGKTIFNIGSVRSDIIFGGSDLVKFLKSIYLHYKPSNFEFKVVLVRALSDKRSKKYYISEIHINMVKG